MTRINLVKPATLSDQHLMAEFREIKHIPAFAVDRLNAGVNFSGRIPRNFTLNEGHKWFFVDKHKFLALRFEELHDELLRRNFNVDRKSVQGWYDWLNQIPEKLFNDWKPSSADLEISKSRIRQRLSEKPNWYRYFGEIETTKFLTNLLECE